MKGSPSALPHRQAPALEETAAAVAMRAAARVRAAVGTARTVRTKSSATDVVTRTDLDVERMIRADLAERAPGSSLDGEEFGQQGGISEVGWIIDPIDGTVNFLYDLPVVSVSIAATLSGTIVAGAVVDVLRGETFSASRGGGARRDGIPIHVNAPQRLAEALLATGFSYDAGIRFTQGAVLQRVVGRARDVRGFGSAAMHLCWVACGRVDGYWEADLKRWDVAAGGLIAAEAGARVRTPWTTGGMLTVAASPGIFDDLYALIAPQKDDGG